MNEEKYALLRTFRSLFEGKPYRHRIANLGDLVASHLYEDLVSLGKSQKLTERVLRFRATNAKPFPFEWVEMEKTELEYSSVLTRPSREYDRRFA